LRSILIQNEVQPGMIADIQARNEILRISEMIRYSSIVVASLPLLIMYPFFQKYFEKGVMVGSLK
jgi:putative aldouronate transport system permease protein